VLLFFLHNDVVFRQNSGERGDNSTFSDAVTLLLLDTNFFFQHYLSDFD